MSLLAWASLAVILLAGLVVLVWALCVAAEIGDEEMAMRDEAHERARTLHE